MKNKREMKRQNGWMKRHRIGGAKKEAEEEPKRSHFIASRYQEWIKFFFGSSHISPGVFSPLVHALFTADDIYTKHIHISHTHTRAKHSQIGFMVFNASQKQTKQIDKRAHTAQTLSFFHSSASAASTELERRNARWAIECVTSHKSQHSDSAPSTRKWYFWFYLFCLTNRTAQRHQCRRIYRTVFSSGRLPLAPLSSLNSAWVRVWHECCDTQIQRISNFLY